MVQRHWQGKLHQIGSLQACTDRCWGRGRNSLCRGLRAHQQCRAKVRARAPGNQKLSKVRHTEWSSRMVLMACR
jgi:hypothetical protein